jgi:hypothetical protein
MKINVEKILEKTFGKERHVTHYQILFRIRTRYAMNDAQLICNVHIPQIMK